MKKADYTYLLQHPQQVSNAKTAELKTIILNFPYFQSARALYLKGLKQQESFQYNNELKKTAAYTTNRTLLFEFITSKAFDKEPIPTEKILSEIEVVDAQVIKALHQEINKQHPSEIALNQLQNTLEINKPLPFKPNETHSFNEWLQIIKISPIERVTDNSTKKLNLIDKFIENKPRITAVKKTADSTVLKNQKNTLDNALMTETLAKVYVAQQKFENAITAYRILSLKYPEKSGFFADQIKAIQLLQKNKA